MVLSFLPGGIAIHESRAANATQGCSNSKGASSKQIQWKNRDCETLLQSASYQP